MGDAQFSWGLNEILYGRREEMFAAATPGLAYGDVFDSRYLVALEEGVEAAVWWLRFYEWSVLRCYVIPQPSATSSPVS